MKNSFNLTSTFFLVLVLVLSIAVSGGEARMEIQRRHPHKHFDIKTGEKVPCSNSTVSSSGSKGSSSKSLSGESKGRESSHSKSSSNKSNSNSTTTTTTSTASSTSGSNSKSSSSTSSASSATRTRPCDQGDQSLAAGLQANVVVGIGMQASVATLQTLISSSKSSASDIKDATDRLKQFLDVSNLQIQMATSIADDDSFAQPQLSELQTSLSDQLKLFGTLKGDASDAKTLDTLLQSALDFTGTSQDGVNNALIDCFLPLTAVSA